MSDSQAHPFGESGHPSTASCQHMLDWPIRSTLLVDSNHCHGVATSLTAVSILLLDCTVQTIAFLRDNSSVGGWPDPFFLQFGFQDVWLGTKHKHPGTFTSLYSLSLITTKPLCRAAFLKKRTGRTIPRANISTSRGRCASNGNTITRSPFPWQWPTCNWLCMCLKITQVPGIYGSKSPPLYRQNYTRWDIYIWCMIVRPVHFLRKAVRHRGFVIYTIHLHIHNHSD